PVANHLHCMAAQPGDHVPAPRLSDQSLDLRREPGDRLGMAVSLNTLADLARKDSDAALAAGLYRQSLRLAREAGNRREAATALVGLAAVADTVERALSLATSAESLMASLGAALDQDVRALMHEVMTRVTAALGEPAVIAARSAAEDKTFEQMTNEGLKD